MPSLAELDKTDRKLLFLLDLNSRQSFSELAKKLKLGSDLVEYRVKKFIEKGIISRFSAIINPAKQGVSIYKTYLKHKMSSERYKQFLLTVENHPATYWLMDAHGRWDSLFSLAASSNYEFQTFQDQILKNFAQDIIETNVYSLVTIKRFPKRYLINGEAPSVSWNAEPCPNLLDELDLRILSEVSVNCRKACTEIARDLGTTRSVVDYRLAQLEKNSVILGYRTQFNYRKIDLIVFKVLVELKDYRPQIRSKLYSFAESKKQITIYIEQIGAYQVELEIEVSTYQEFISIIEDFRSTLGAYLGRIDYMLVKNDYYHRAPITKQKL